MTEISSKMMYDELNDLRKEINDKLDCMAEKMDKMSDSRISRNELELYCKPLEQKVNLHDRILWGVGAAAGLSLLDSFFRLIAK